MRVALATDPGTPGWPNEDFAAVAPGAAVLLDGCTTTPRGAGTGCLHGVAWYARTLGTVFLGAITADPPVPLADALAGAIGEVRSYHEGTCDLANPSTPAATVIAVRAAQAGFETLALSDSSIVADFGDRPGQRVAEGRRRIGGDRRQERGAEGPGVPGDPVQASGVRPVRGGGAAVQQHRGAGRGRREILVGPARRAGVGGQRDAHPPLLLR